MMNHLRRFFAFLLPILGRASAQVAADLLFDYTHPPRRHVSYDRRTRRYTPPRTRPTTGPLFRQPDPYPWRAKHPEPDIDRYTENYNRVHDRTDDFHDVLLVAFDLRGISARDVHDTLQSLMPKADAFYGENEDVYLDSWWVANDERFDGSDCDSAVFVKKGMQAGARRYLHSYGLSDEAAQRGEA